MGQLHQTATTAFFSISGLQQSLNSLKCGSKRGCGSKHGSKRGCGSKHGSKRGCGSTPLRSTIEGD